MIQCWLRPETIYIIDTVFLAMPIALVILLAVYLGYGLWKSERSKKNK